MSEVRLHVNGRRYGGWKSIQITRSIQTFAGAFSLGVSEAWAGRESRPIAEEDRCQVSIDEEVVIDGYVDKRQPRLAAESRPLTISGRDLSAVLVDCSVVLKQWSFANITIADLVAKLAAPFDIAVSVQGDLPLTRLPKVDVHPGDKVSAVIGRAAKTSGVLVVSDGAGGVHITRAGERKAEALIQGRNILEAWCDFDSTKRYCRYVAYSQVSGSDKAFGVAAAAIKVEAFDEGVRRKDRVLLVRPKTAHGAADLRRRVDWEARVRAAKAETVHVTVKGWRQPNETLWPINALTFVDAAAIGIMGELLIVQAEYSLDDSGGQKTMLTLMRPDAFIPEPTVAKVKAAGNAFKLPAGGAK